MNWVILVLISAILFAAANIIRKFVLNKEHTLEFLAARGFFTIFLLLFLAPWVDTGIDFRILGLICLASIVATVGYYYQTKAQRHTDISYCAPLQNLAPLFLLIFAYLFLHETISTVQLLGVLAIVAGSYTLAIEPGTKLFPGLQSIFNGPGWHIAISVVLLAVAAVLDKFMLGIIRPVTYVFFGWLFMNLTWISLHWIQYDWSHVLVDFKKGWHWLLLSAIFSLASALFFFEGIASPAVLVSLALPLKRISALIETLFGGALFHEKHLPRRLLAGLIMLVGVVLIAKS